MKRFVTSLLVVCCMLTVVAAAQAQDKPKASLKASVMQRIGVETDITITYSRPGVKSRTIWGELVPYGMAKDRDKSYPWRAGADENTTFEVSKDVVVEGKALPAGKYGLHMIPGEKEWTIIFSKNASSWGSYSYNEAEDALRITVTPQEASHKEWLTYGFENLDGNSATAYLHWEKLKAPFTVAAAGSMMTEKQ